MGLRGLTSEYPQQRLWSRIKALVPITAVLLWPARLWCQSADFGDAPDPPYPSVTISGGVRHLDTTKEWIGPASSSTSVESDSLQPNGDLDDTNTWVVDVAAQLFIITRLSHDGSEPGVVRYLNVLVDLDNNGAWDGSATEWPLQNYQLQFSELFPAGTNTGWLMVGIASTNQAADYLQKWARVTVSTTPVPDGTGQWGTLPRGETEDHQLAPAPITKPSSLNRLPAFVARRPVYRHGHRHALDQVDPDASLVFRFPADAAAPCSYRVGVRRIADTPADNPYGGAVGGFPLPPMGPLVWSPWAGLPCPGAAPIELLINGSFPRPNDDGDSDFRYRVQLLFDPAGEMVFFDSHEAEIDGSITSTAAVSPALTQSVNFGRNQIGYVESAQVTPAGDSFDIIAGGNDIWDILDEFTFVYEEVTGDFDVTVRVENLSPNARWSKAGLMVRETLSEDSRMIFNRVTPPNVPTLNGGNGANDTRLTYRTGNHLSNGTFGDSHNDGNHEDIAAANPLPSPPYPNAWLRLTREGSLFTAFNSSDGQTWHFMASQDTSTWNLGPLPPTVHVGLAASRHSGGPTVRAAFRNLRLQQPPASSASLFEILRVSSRGNPNGVRVEFNQPIGAGGTDPRRYTVSGATVLAAAVLPNNPSAVQLKTSPLTEGVSYNVSASNLANFRGDPVSAAVRSFVHGAGFEPRRIHAIRNWVNLLLPDFEQTQAYKRGIGTDSIRWRPSVRGVSLFEDPLPTDAAREDFALSLRGLLVPSQSGDHRFYMSSDDQAILYLSTDESPSKKVEIAREPAWNGRREWITGANQASRGSPPANISALIPLVAGKEYYAELVTREDGGGDGSGATWQPPGAPAPVNGALPIAEANFALSRFAHGSLFRTLGPVQIVYQPLDQVVPVGGAATFSVRADGTPPYSYQWNRNGEPIPGARSQSYTLSPAADADNGALFTCVLKNEFSEVLSAGATLTVINNPRVHGCTTRNHPNRVFVTFNKPVNLDGSYQINGGSIAVLGATHCTASQDVVCLDTAPIPQDTLNDLQVIGVTDLEGNVLSPDPAACQFVQGPGRFCADFSGALPSSAALIGGARLADGVLHLTDAGQANAFGALVVNLPGAQTFQDFHASWRAYLGGGTGGGADGYSLNVANDLPSTFGYMSFEEGLGTGLSVTVDTFDNGGGETGAEIRWRGQRVAFDPEAKSGIGEGDYLRKSDFVDCELHVTPGGIVTFKHDTVLLTAQLPGYDGINANRYVLGARTGGGNDNHWIDNLCINNSTLGPIAISGLQPQTEASECSKLTLHVDLNGSTPMQIQWLKNEVPIPGAVHPWLDLQVSREDDGAVISIHVQNALGLATASTVLQPQIDDSPPALVCTSAMQDRVAAAFDELLDESTAEDVLSYSINGASPGQGIESAELLADRKSLNIVLSEPIVGPYSLTATARDACAGNVGATTAQGNPSDWQSAPIGNPSPPTTTFSCDPDSFQITSGGSPWGLTSSGGLVYQERTGDCDITVRLDGLTCPSSGAFAGVMACSSTAPDSPAILIALSPGYGLVLAYREAPGLPMNFFVDDSVPFGALWLGISRNGDIFTTYYSSDGLTWRTGTQYTFESGSVPEKMVYGTVVTSQTQGIPATCRFSQPTICSSAADLEVIKTVSASQAAVDSEFTYTIIVTNRGPAAAEGVKFTDRISAGLKMLSYRTSAGTCRDNAWFGINPREFSCDFGTIAPGGAVIVTVRATGYVPGAETNYATATTTSPDPNLSNNSSEVPILIVPAPAPQLGVAGSSGNELQMSFAGEVGKLYALRTSTDLETWSPIYQFSYMGVPLLLRQAISAGEPHRFYSVSEVTLDPTALPTRPAFTGEGDQGIAINDQYIAPSSCPEPCNVLLHSGEENFERTDLVIPGRGEIHFVMARHYRSRLNYDGPLGFGWTFAYNERLFIEPNGDVTRVNGNSHLDTWVREGNGTFRAPPGQFRALQEEAYGGYRLREANGFLRFYAANGLLLMHQDRFGNGMIFGYDSRGLLRQVTDSYGRIIEFFFETFPDGNDRLMRVRDFIGREVVYSYDANGDLVSVRTPAVTGTSTGNDFPNGRTERYTYSSGFAQPDLNHNLLSVTLPVEVAAGGPSAIAWTYGTNPADPVSFDRVTAQTIGGTNASGISAGGTTSIEYAALNREVALGNPDVLRARASVTQRNGNQMEHFFNELHHHILTRQMTRGLRVGEPAYYETRSFFNTDGLLLRRVFPETNEVRYAYASTDARPQQQNVVEARRVAGPRGGGADLVTTFTYEPLYNQIASVTDPRGNSSTYTPPIGTRSAARYTTRFFYDYQESNATITHTQALGIDLSGVPRNLGDLNADGRTDQLFGNLVRIQSPTVELLPDSNEATRSGSTLQQIVTEIQWNDRGQRTAIIDAAGNVQEFQYYPDNDPDGDGQIVPTLISHVPGAFSGYLRSTITDARVSARRTAQTPPAALETVYRYDRVGNTVAIRNPRGVVTELEVNQLNEIVRIIRGADVTAAASSGQLVENEAARRYEARNIYDFNGRVVRRETENRDSNTAGVGAFIEQTFTHDILNNLLQRTAEVDANTILTWQYRYDPEQLPTTVTKPEGNTDLVEYDERNLPFRITRGFGSLDASTVQVDYDRNGNRKRVTDAEDNNGDGQPESVVFSYDGFDRLTRATDALGNFTLNFFDVAGNVVRSQQYGHRPNNPASIPVRLAETFFRRDELSRVFQRDAALFLADGFNPARPPSLQDHNNDGLVTSRHEYDALSRVTFSVEDDLETTRSIYDGVGRVIETIDALGNRRRVSHDRNSNPVRVESIEVSPEGLVANKSFITTYVFDQLDRVVRATDNAGQTTRFAYDSRNNLVHRSDPEGPLTVDPLGLFPGNINAPGNTYSYFHDGLDRMIQQICDLRVGGTGAGALDTSNPRNPDGQITLSYEFDRNSRLTGIIDDNNNRTSFGYDALDRKVSQTNADGEIYIFGYDKDSNVRTVTDPNGSVTTKTYDGVHRLIESTVVRGVNVLGTTRETYGYDGLGRLVQATDDNGSPAASQHVVEQVYDSLGRLIEERQDGRVISSQYTGDGKRTQVTYPGGRSITRTFDLIDRIKQINDGAAVLAASDWIGPGMRELQRLNGNGTRLTFLNDAGDQDTGYDSVRRIVRLRCLLPDDVTAFVDREHSYNRASQRTAERRHDDFGLTDRYTYDSAYRVAASAYDQDGLPGVTPRDLKSIAYGYDGVGNRRDVTKDSTAAGVVAESYLVNEMNEYTAVAGVTRVHDDNGNLTDDGTRLFRYDYKNRLVSVSDKVSGNPIATYEYLPDARRAKKIVHTEPTPRQTVFLWDGQQEIEEQDASGATQTTFVWSPVYIDELVQYQNSLGAFYTHQDARCSIVAITDASGAVVERIRYDDFGNAEILSPLGEARAESAIGNSYTFQGRRLDPETGLLYFRARYYDLQTGRFLQRDPIWDAGNVGGQYTFVGNGPLNGRDPSGLQESLFEEEAARALQRLKMLESLPSEPTTTTPAAANAPSGPPVDPQALYYALCEAGADYNQFAMTSFPQVRSAFASARDAYWQAAAAVAMELNAADTLARMPGIHDWNTYVNSPAYKAMVAQREEARRLIMIHGTYHLFITCAGAGAGPLVNVPSGATGQPQSVRLVPGTARAVDPCSKYGGGGMSTTVRVAPPPPPPQSSNNLRDAATEMIAPAPDARFGAPADRMGVTMIVESVNVNQITGTGLVGGTPTLPNSNLIIARWATGWRPSWCRPEWMNLPEPPPEFLQEYWGRD